jgi:hypothetical protein
MKIPITDRTIHYEWRNQPVEAFGYKFKSRIEYRWAKYLELLRVSGEVQTWQYEPETFLFKERHRKKGIYTPDFRVVWRDGTVELQETKSSLRQKDVYRFRQFAMDYPSVRIVLVLPSCPKRSVKQLILLDNAKKYVADVIFCGPIFRKLGI